MSDAKLMDVEFTKTLGLRTDTVALEPVTNELSSVGPLVCYINTGHNWLRIDIDPEDKKLDLLPIILKKGLPFISLKDKKREKEQNNGIYAIKHQGFWFVHSKDTEKHISYNSITPNQDIIVRNSTSYICVDNQKALFTTLDPADELTSKLSLGAPGCKEYGIVCDGRKFCCSVHKSILLGSHNLCDVSVPGNAFSALIFIYRNKLYLSNFGFEPILINGEEFEGECAALQNNDIITINEQSITVTLPDNHADPYTEQHYINSLCLLDIYSDDCLFKKMVLPVNKAFSLGRNDENELQIQDNNISRKHAQLFVYEDHVLLIDSYSKNGTLLNKKKIAKARARIGDLVTFGNKNYILTHYYG